MYVLGINPGHNGTASLLKDGKIIACVSEERFSRIKNHFGFPHKSIRYLLDFEGITPQDLDYVILGIFIGRKIKASGKKYDSFNNNYTKKKRLKKLFGNLVYKYPSLMGKIIDIKHAREERRTQKLMGNSCEEIANYLGIERRKVIYIDHHHAHALSTCFNLPSDRKSLVFTLDAEGEGLCATVSIYDGETKSLMKIAETKKGHSLGYLYAIATIFLGMKANEHEFKVMGMAPYAKQDKVKKIYPLFRDIIRVDGLKFKSKFKMQYADSFFEDKMKFVRFDTISAAIQQLTEDLTCQWVSNAIRKTGINSIALTGGVFMNVKACQRISELPEVEKIFVMPSSGDESTAIGACLFGYKKYCEENSILPSPSPIKDLYLGPRYTNDYIADLIKEQNLEKKYIIKKFKNINAEVAKLLAKGKIVARCSGRSEWGARALGNRSIIANPSNKDTIRVLNETIKDRDFWMPFTPSIIDKALKNYAKNPKNIFAPYMIITFDSTEKAQKDIPAAMHPYDFTIRPQEVTKSYNPDYYEIIDKFNKATKIGGVLNTSFNLHGSPNVLTPEDALHTVENSSLRYLALENYLFEKRKGI